MTVTAAQMPGEPWPFRLHVATEAADRRIVVGDELAWRLGLGVALRRDLRERLGVARSRAFVLIGAVPRSVLLDRLAAELAWGLEHSIMRVQSNAARALRLTLEKAICSKLDGGERPSLPASPPP